MRSPISTIPTVIKPTIYIIAGFFAPSLHNRVLGYDKTRGTKLNWRECGEAVYRVHGVIGCRGNIRDSFNEKV